MARFAAAAALICLIAASSASLAAAAGIEHLQDTSYKQLKPVAGQWKIAVSATKGADKSTFVPLACDNGEKVSAPCNQPLLTADAKDKLQVALTLKNKTLRTIDNLTPKKLLVRACYTKPSATDRPWRKANEVIDKDKSCPFIIKSTDFNATASSFTFDWALPKNMTKAAWYAQVLVTCQNGTLSSYCQTDSTKNTTYWGTNIINSTPVGMVIATAVASSIAPLFLGAYFIKDFFGRSKLSSGAPAS